MSLKRTIDTTQRSAGDIERAAGNVEPGWHRATIAEVYEDHKHAGNIILQFRLADGREIKQTLFDPDMSEDAKAAKRARDRIDAWAVRVGIVSRDLKGVVAEYDWEDAINRTVALDMEMSKPNAEGRSYAQIKWVGVFPLDDERVPEAIRRGTAVYVPPEAAKAETKANRGRTAAAASNGQTRLPGIPTGEQGSGNGGDSHGSGGVAAATMTAPATRGRVNLDDL